MKGDVEMHAEIYIVLAFLAFSIAACVLPASQAPGEVEGTVLNIANGEPLPGVFVVAKASGHVSGFMTGYFTCYRTGMAVTDEAGFFRMPDSFSSVPSKQKIDNDWKSISILLYKPYFQTAEKSLSEDMADHDQLLSSLGRRQPTKSRPRYMEPSVASREERLRYLFLMSQHAACERQGNPALLPFYKAIYSEAKELARTDYEKFLLDKMRYIIDVQSNPATRAPVLHENLLFRTVKSERISDVVHLLRTISVSALELILNDRDADDRTPLMLAANVGHYEIVGELIKAGADVNKATFSGETALGLALKQLLLSRIDKRNAESAFKLTVKTLLQSPKIDLGQPCTNGKTPLIYTVGGWYTAMPDVFTFILERGADPNIEIYAGTIYRQRVLGSVLDKEVHSSVSAGLPLLKTLLRSEKLDLNAIVFENKTALIYVAHHGRPDLIKILLDAGADPNVSVKPGITALGAAVQHAILNASRKNYLRVVEALLEAESIDIDAVAYNGKSAIELAKRSFRSDIVDMLEAKRRRKPI